MNTTRWETPDPVEAIKFHMEQNDLRSRDLAEIVGSRSRASEVLNHRRNLSLSQIRKLHRTWHIPASILIGEEKPVAKNRITE